MAERKSAKNLTEYMETLDAATRDRIEFEVSVMSKVIEARKQKGMTQKDLADITGLKQPAIARFEKFEKIPQIDTIFTVLRPLGYKLKVVPIEEERTALN